MSTNIKEGLSFANGDGWKINVGQVYSNPYEPYHIEITQIVIEEPDLQSAKIYFRYVDPKDHTKVVDEFDENTWHRAWFINEQWSPEKWDSGDEVDQ